MQYRIYHDESQEDGYWHGILFVPETEREKLLGLLKQIRDLKDYDEQLSFRRLRTTSSERFEVTRLWIETAYCAMAQRVRADSPLVIKSKEKKYLPNLGRRAAEYEDLIKFEEPISIKFVLFRERDNLQSMNPDFFADYAAKVETTFRMALKGGCHFLFDEENPMELVSLHFDGHKHHKRQLDKNRIITKLKYEFRDYCNFHTDANIYDDPSNHNKDDSQPYDDCQLIQLTDLLIGAFRVQITNSGRPVQIEASEPVKLLVEKWSKGSARMRNSRWYGGFSITDAYLEDGEWNFDNLITNNLGQDRQMSIIFN